jgi:transposase
MREIAMTYYAGIDISLRSVNICVVDDDGECLAESKLSSDVQEIIAYLDELECAIDVVGLEAGTLTQYLTYGLQAADFNVVCMEAQQVKAALSAMRNKTDKHDARGIAQLLRSGWYRQVHIKSMESHHIRMLLTSRNVAHDSKATSDGFCLHRNSANFLRVSERLQSSLPRPETSMDSVGFRRLPT